MTVELKHEVKNAAASPEVALSKGRDAFLGFLIRRLGNRADAEDVYQEFCIRVLLRQDQLRDIERMDAWLYSILRSTLNDHYRKSARRGRLAEAYGREPEEKSEDASDLMAQLCVCVGGLLPDMRPADADLIRRIDFDDGDRATIAADLGLSRGALGVRLHRARTALRDALLGHCSGCCQTEFEDCYCSPTE